MAAARSGAVGLTRLIRPASTAAGPLAGAQAPSLADPVVKLRPVRLMGRCGLLLD